MNPDQALFTEHLNSASFEFGVDSGWWRITETPMVETWPEFLICVESTQEVIAEGELWLSFKLSGYPATAPTSCPWDSAKSERLANDRWPNRERSKNIKSIFNPNWEGGVALYAPWDSAGLKCHPEWKTKYPHWAWKPEWEIADYLRLTHQVLNPPR